MTKPALLFLAHRIPYPPNKGDKIRSYNLLKSLARDYRIYLGAFVDDENDWRYEPVLKDICTEVFLLGIRSSLRKLQSCTAFFTGEALSLPYYRNSQMQQWVDSTIQDADISRVFVFSSAMAQYVEKEIYRPLHRVVDFVDVDSDKWQQYSLRKAWPMNRVYRREADKLLEYDRVIASSFDASVFVSEHEAALFKTLAPESEQKITHINNGVDFHYFDPQQNLPNPYPENVRVIAFTGAMDYWANVDAVTRFVEHMLPAIQSKDPNVHFYIVGSRPAEKVLALASRAGVHVTGSVKDIRPYILHSDIIVAPMRIARGIQNKVLEAMAMEKPVVATHAAMEGIEPVAGQLVCNSEQQFIDSCLDLLSNGDQHRTGPAGRESILASFNWEQNLLRLESLLGDNKAALQVAVAGESPTNMSTQETLS
jgi:sugar transferase (PEP-CTERM/EpsH1 system associated)